MADNKYLEDFKERLKDPQNWKKNQHYIPQFYLKKFCNQEKKLETLDKEKKRILKSQSVEHVCSWDYFYWLETWKKDMTSQILEEMFDYFEDRFSQIYNNLIDDIYSTHQINQDFLYWLCEFVAISRMRWKYFRETFKEMSQDLMKQIFQRWYEMMKYYNPENEHIKNILEDNNADNMIVNWKFKIEENNANYIKFITDEKNILWFTNCFLHKKINIYIANWTRNFVTSDCCVTELLPGKFWPFWVSFIERLHYFALSPRILVEFSVPDLGKKKQKVKRKHIWNEEVIYYNFLRSMQWRYLYSCSKDDFIEEEYSKARFDNLEKLSKLFPDLFLNESLSKDKITEIAKNTGISIETIKELLKENSTLKMAVKNAIKK